MANPPSRGRSPYGSPDAVLAEAHRIAADIRRRAERDAIAVRREAAEWASATRREAERYRERVLAELEHAQAVAEETDAPAATADAAAPDEPAPTPVIDLRRAAAARPVRLVESHDDEPPPDTDDEEDEVAPRAQEAATEVEHRPAVGGTYVVGRSLPPPSTSIETKVHDVVRLAVRRTFHRHFP